MMNVWAGQGRIVSEPELRKTPNGISTTTITIACERNFVKQGEERITDFIDVVAWRGTSEFICKYFSKGSLIAVNGSLQSRKWEDKSGNKRVSWEIIADNVHFCEGRANNTQQSQQASVQDEFEIISDDGDLPFNCDR